MAVKVNDIRTIQIQIMSEFCKIYEICFERMDKYLEIKSDIERMSSKNQELNKIIDKNIIDSGTALDNMSSNKLKLDKLNKDYDSLYEQRALIMNGMDYKKSELKSYESIFIPLFNEINPDNRLKKDYDIIVSIVSAYDLLTEFDSYQSNNSLLNRVKNKIKLNNLMKKLNNEKIGDKINYFNSNIDNILVINSYMKRLNDVCFELDNPITVVNNDISKNNRINELKNMRDSLLTYDETITKSKSVA